MRLSELWTRVLPPAPWHEGDNIPWSDPAFSARMLDEHLSQSHDAASRRSARIARHVEWIHEAVLHGHPTVILDLGCGPGLYTSRLARFGHTCVGIDFSPASIAYARDVAAQQLLACQYRLADLRDADFGAGFGLAMCIFGELNVFPRGQAAALLAKAYHALADGGLLLLEVQTFAAIQQTGERAPAWFTAESGLFGATPYLCLVEHFWHAPVNAATTRYYVVDLASGGMIRYAQSFQAYTQPEYEQLLRSCGFGDITFVPSLTGAPDPGQPDMLVIAARKTDSYDTEQRSEDADAKRTCR
jgi:SAM-dependent methyltransferase